MNPQLFVAKRQNSGMVDCEYCNESFQGLSPDDSEFLNHLAEEHVHEVGRIDEKRLRVQWDGDLEEARSITYEWNALTIGAGVSGLVTILGLVVVAVL